MGVVKSKELAAFGVVLPVSNILLAGRHRGFRQGFPGLIVAVDYVIPVQVFKPHHHGILHFFGNPVGIYHQVLLWHGGDSFCQFLTIRSGPCHILRIPRPTFWVHALLERIPAVKGITRPLRGRYTAQLVLNIAPWRGQDWFHIRTISSKDNVRVALFGVGEDFLRLSICGHGERHLFGDILEIANKLLILNGYFCGRWRLSNHSV